MGHEEPESGPSEIEDKNGSGIFPRLGQTKRCLVSGSLLNEGISLSRTHFVSGTPTRGTVQKIAGASTVITLMVRLYPQDYNAAGPRRRVRRRPSEQEEDLSVGPMM